MSHFVTLIITHKDILNLNKEDVNKELNKVLERYYEGYELKEPLKEYFKNDELSKMANCYKFNLADPKTDTLEKVKEHIKEWNGGFDVGVDENGFFYHTICNDKGYWDLWVIGGRWDGWISDNERSSDNGFNFDEIHRTVENNNKPTKYLIEKEKIPFTIVTPDGEWHQRAKMGWFCCTDKEMDKDDWRDICMEIYKKYDNDKFIAIACDMHI